MDEILPGRQHKILLALIREFIETAEPVGSNTLYRKHNLKASPATIRNDMAKLEEKNYLMQPHTSSGRIPTDKGYRYYVNYLMSQKMKTPGDVKKDLQEFEKFQAGLEKLVQYSCRILADMTHHTSLVLVPRIRRTMFKYLKLTPIEDKQILIILMTNTGSIINKVIRLEREFDEEELDRMTRILNDRLSGMYLKDIRMDFLTEIEGELQTDILKHISLLTRETFQDQDDRFIYDGTANLLDLPEFQNLEKLKLVMELLEEEKVISQILKQTLFNEGVKIYIGHEISIDPIAGCSFITATYQIGSTPVGTVAVMGPTRIPYHRVIPVVNAFADIFSKKLTLISKI